MNGKVFLVTATGIAFMAILFVFPPWKLDGHYAGHLRIDLLWGFGWELDVKRFFIEQIFIALASLILAVKFWKKGHHAQLLTLSLITLVAATCYALYRFLF
jgi:hypothetical protein